MSSSTSRSPSTESLFSHWQTLSWHETHPLLGILRSTSEHLKMKCSQTVHHGTAPRDSTQYPAQTIASVAAQYVFGLRPFCFHQSLLWAGAFRFPSVCHDESSSFPSMSWEMETVSKGAHQHWLQRDVSWEELKDSIKKQEMKNSYFSASWLLMHLLSELPSLPIPLEVLTFVWLVLLIPVL